MMKLFVFFMAVFSVGAFAKDLSRDLNSKLLLAYASNEKNQAGNRLSYDLSSSKTSFAQERNGFEGDMRFRYLQHIGSEMSYPDFHLLFKGGWFAQLTPQLGWNFQLASGGWVQNVHGQKKSKVDRFGGKSVWLNGASLSYSPWESYEIELGKMSSYFDFERQNLIWDEDLAPEGLSLVYHKSFFDRYVVDLKAGWLLIHSVSPLIAGHGASRVDLTREEINSEEQELIHSENRGMLTAGAQVLMDYEDYDFTAGASYYRAGLKGVSPPLYTTNSVDKDRKYRYDYSIVDLFLQLAINRARFPLSLSIQLVQNFGVESGWIKPESFGYITGGFFGRKDPKSFNFEYSFFKLPTDVTMSHFVDSDIGGTGYAGHQLAVSYFFNKSVSAELKYILRTDSRGSKPLNHIAFCSLSMQI